MSFVLGTKLNSFLGFKSVEVTSYLLADISFLIDGFWESVGSF